METISYNEVLYRAAEAAGRTRDNLPLEEAALLKSVFALQLRPAWLSEDWDDLRQPILAVTLDANGAFTSPYLEPIAGTVTVSGAGDADSNGNYVQGADTNAPDDYYQAAHGYRITNDGSQYIIQSGGEGLNQYVSPTLIGAYTSAGPDNAPNPTVAYATTAYTLGAVLAVFDQDPNGSTPWTRLPFHREGDVFKPTPGRAPFWTAATVPDTVYVYYQSKCPDLLALSAAELTALTLPLVFGNHLALHGAAQLLIADSASSLAGVNLGLAKTQLDFERTQIKRPAWMRQEQ